MTNLETFLAILPNSPEDQVLRLLIELGLAVSGGEQGSLLAFDPAADDLVFAMTVGGDPVLIGQRVPLGKGITGLAAATGEVQIGAPTFWIEPGEAHPEGPEAVIAAPMVVLDELIGVITTVSFEKGKRFGSDGAELYGKLATVAGLVVWQRRKLAGASAAVNADTPEAGIARTIGTILRARPGAAPQMAILLAALARMAGVDPP